MVTYESVLYSTALLLIDMTPDDDFHRQQDTSSTIRCTKKAELSSDRMLRC